MNRSFCFVLACLMVAMIPASAAPVPEPDPSVAEIVAAHVTDTTMTAMSPLLVVSAQGAWEYYHADTTIRANLPWYTSPWLWGSLLTLGGLFTLNTAIGNAVPLLKTPMNVVEEHENKITGLLIGLPMVLTKLFPDLAMPSSLGHTAGVNDSLLPVAMSAPWVAGLVAVPIVIACYLMVWLTFHSMQVIALVSPFGIIDTCLKMSRLGLLGAILLLSFASPILGMLFCAVIIAISYFIAGWSFRLLVFGSILSWDLMLFRHRRVRPDTDVIARGFLCSAVDTAPVRSYGTLTLTPSGTYHFHYRPWLILPEQSVALPAEGIIIQRGILSPTARSRATTDQRSMHLVRLRPKYRGHEEHLARILDATEIEDHIIARGLYQASHWLRDWCRPTATAQA
ncbi:MAG: hypothetical protein KDN22_06160 [Verrucomicrobiae bacterium]|nr:hypothetical protein [Verrucomicrobiae bacterium]